MDNSIENVFVKLSQQETPGFLELLAALNQISDLQVDAQCENSLDLDPEHHLQRCIHCD